MTWFATTFSVLEKPEERKKSLLLNPIEPGSPKRGTSKATGDSGVSGRHIDRTVHFLNIL
ncbi:hypothetical protein [Pedobacter jejuensis]|uniref:hypothetical protein n=1 Tax=Pedobacter jejuensis TaxID=1268550 RepID=UPI00142DAB68|nr:hypothetical protein [Pedobacter jejuensis]